MTHHHGPPYYQTKLNTPYVHIQVLIIAIFICYWNQTAWSSDQPHLFPFLLCLKIGWLTEAPSQTLLKSDFCLSFSSRRYFRSTRMRATRSWLQTLKFSQASRFRTCWSPFCTRSTRGKSRVLLDEELRSCYSIVCLTQTGLPHIAAVVWCGSKKKAM